MDRHLDDWSFACVRSGFGCFLARAFRDYLLCITQVPSEVNCVQVQTVIEASQKTDSTLEDRWPESPMNQ